MIFNINMFIPDGDIKHCIIVLPGRGYRSEQLLYLYHNNCELPNTAFVGITPMELSWYPQPHSPTNQDEAVNGLKETFVVIDQQIDQFSRYFNLPRNKIILAGFSAGGVLALYLGMHTTNPIGAIICHNGAIFEPNKVPVCKNTNPFYVTHGLNDDCFDWVERYLPMKESLIQNNYNVDFLENDGYHIVAPSDVKLVNQYLCKYFAT